MNPFLDFQDLCTTTFSSKLLASDDGLKLLTQAILFPSFPVLFMLKLSFEVSSSGLAENSKLCGKDLIPKQTKICTIEPEVRSS